MLQSDRVVKCQLDCKSFEIEIFPKQSDVEDASSQVYEICISFIVIAHCNKQTGKKKR